MRVPDLELDLLRCFVEVTERGGFTAAGAVLGLTQSAVSLKIKRLEDLVGRSLLDRGPKRTTPTREGEALLAHARRMLALNEEAVRRIVAPPVTGRLRLGVADHFLPRGLAPLLARIAGRYPELRLEVEVGRSAELRAAQAAGRLDLVLGKRRDGETEGRALWTEPLVWAAAPGWAPPEGRPLPLAMLPQGCLLRERALAVLARAAIGAEIVYASASLLGVAAAAQAGLAATILGRSGLPEGLVPLAGLPDPGTAVMALFGEAGGHPAAAPLLEALQETLGRQG
jgi:DNA-binding transcriptional LysR family regulator